MSWCPGEELLARLWETLAEKGLGRLLKPGQMRREGLVELELERAKILTNAQAEREADDIKNGRKDLTDFSVELGFSKKQNFRTDLTSRIEPVVGIEFVAEAVKASVVSEAMRREINTSGAIIFAEEALSNDKGHAPEQKIDDDWLHRWRGYTGDVSNDKLQRLWGRLLAGEVKEPGSYSLRCLDFLSNLSQSEARLIEKLSKLKVDAYIWRNMKHSNPEFLYELLQLQELGIVSAVEAGGLVNVTSGLQHGTTQWIRGLRSHSKCLIVRSSNNTATLKIDVYPITNLGLQVMNLGSFDADV